MDSREKKGVVGMLLGVLFLVVMVAGEPTAMEVKSSPAAARHKNAYATMMYMGTPRDYEFYVATRVLIRSLVRLGVDADLVVIASVDVPSRWVRAMEEEDGARVIKVENLNNPYRGFDLNWRFRLTLNKLYVWSLVDYDRVVMLDADNLFLRKSDELFQCGQFCAVFINPCIFHTGLFVLQPSMKEFKNMIHELEIGKENKDGADQGFIGNHFPNLLDKPMFHPPQNGTTLDGQYRLHLGYQMDATYYYLRLRWNVPCGENSVITFPGAPWLKPWYWWSWPVLPLGVQWHDQRRNTIGYGDEAPVILILAALYLGLITVTRLARPNISKLCYRRSEKSTLLIQTGLKVVAVWSILAAYTVPFFVIPCTIHPVVGWAMYFLGVFALSTVAVNTFVLPMLPVLTPGIGIFGSLLVMAYPWYPDGVIRALSLFGYAFCCAPFLWAALTKVMVGLQGFHEREQLLPKVGDYSPPGMFRKKNKKESPFSRERN